MELLKKRNFWISVAACLIFSAVIYPYNHDMYIGWIFTVICALMNFLSAAVFASLLYRKLEGTFPTEEFGSYVLCLLLLVQPHALFAMINWGSWVCLGLTVVALFALWHSWRKAHPREKKVMTRRQKILRGLLMTMLVCVLVFFLSPSLRIRAFVAMHGEEIEQRLEEAEIILVDGEKKLPSPAIPDYIGTRHFNLWPGEHDMVEFELFAWGIVPSSTYYGCYYSYDDVPLAFQNADWELTQTGHDFWEWQGEGDNHGSTRKIRDHWYYYEASF